MSLAAGTRLGPYEILGPIGAGGMGEVYKARDTRLDRTVAIKVLPADIRADADRRARFEREAKAIAGLAHPHICTLHDVGEHAGSTFLVMEHLDGQTLAERLKKGALPLDQALAIAIEIADALSAAHRHGVIHRDLKPGNVMLTKSGAKLLDFGLAKLTRSEPAAAAHFATTLTRSAPLTEEGVIIGTLQYMSPEQIENKPVDARSDLWAFGATVYEMVAGKRPFQGESSASVISAIIDREPPPLATLQPLTPPALDRLVRQCLAKSPDARPDTSHDVANELRRLRESIGINHPGAAPASRRSPVMNAAALLLIGVVLTSFVWWLAAQRRPAVPAAPVMQVELAVLPAEELNAGGVSAFVLTPGGSRTALTWTPDGRTLVFVGRRDGKQQLYVNKLDGQDAQPLADTEGAQAPAVSANGEWIAFVAAGALKKVRLSGGPVMELAPKVGLPNALLWDGNERLFFGRFEGGIWQVPAGTGEPARVTTLGEGEQAHHLSAVLTNQRTILYTVRKGLWTWGGDELVAHNVDTGKHQVVLKDAADARYVATGHLVFLRKGTLFAVPFDVDSLKATGDAVPIRTGVVQALTALNSYDVTGAGQFAVATTGSLAFIAGPTVPPRESALVAVDRHGQRSDFGAPQKAYGASVRVSPNGRRLAVTIETLTEIGVWIYDLDRPGALAPLQGGGEAEWVRWSGDGRRIAFTRTHEGRGAIVSQSADGSTPPEVIVPTSCNLSSWAPGGELLVSCAKGAMSINPAERPARLEALSPTANPPWSSPDVSPDGEWLAYHQRRPMSGSNEPGRSDVYVMPYGRPGAPILVSTDGGSSPAWNSTGRELFFLSGRVADATMKMMVVSFEPGNPPRIGLPIKLFPFDPSDLAFGPCPPSRCYDVAPGGQRFYVRKLLTSSAPRVTRISLVLNWFEELKAKAGGIIAAGSR